MEKGIKNPAPVRRCGARKIDHAGWLIKPENTSCPSKIQERGLPRRHAHLCHDILAEYQQCDHLSGEVLWALLRYKVDVKEIWKRVRNGLADHPRQARVVYLPGNGFEIVSYRGDKPDIGAMIFLVRDEFGDAIDLAAWSPPRRPALWCARGALLGAENLFGFRIREAIEVHQSPLEWLRGGCTGVVVLDAVKAAPLLRRAEPLQVATGAQGRILRRMLEVKRPRILVPAAHRRAP
jgi:hypothetical protein